MAEAIFQVVIENLTSLIQEKIGSIIGVDKEMRKLSKTLTTIQKVLEDAEDQQFQNQTIKNWLRELNDIAYEVEDILDDCNTEVLRLKRKGGKFNPKKVLFKYKIARRIKDAVEKLDAVAENRKFHLDETVLRQSNRVDWRETGFVLKEPDHIYGREEDREKIVDVLVNQVKDCEHLSVLPIVSIGGMGKTTLAQLVYDDKRVDQNFDTKLWVCVSDHYDLKAILRAIIQDKSNLEGLNSLQLRLRQELSGKKYLLILDDVWNDNQEEWCLLKSILECGSMGASIVVTTRQENVADIMGTLSPHCLSKLSDEDCWLMFKLRAFGKESEQCPGNLEIIGRRIVKKCYGVPLAAKALGGLLRFQKEDKEWVLLEKSQMWNISGAEDSILAVLRLSYRNLPFILKRCFIHCALFPKDYRFGKTELMFHWMAHGCISSDVKRQVEEVGDYAWNELALRSFFQEIDTSGREIRFKMHDLVHDLALSIMENRAHGAENESRIRQVCFNENIIETSCSSIAVEVSSLTTIINFYRLRSLKLNLWELQMEELPSAIGKLKQLRCLNLKHCYYLRTLPRTFCSLYNLQVLILSECFILESLPKNIRYMSSLRHILLDGCYSLKDMPRGMGELTCLKSLSLFIVGDKKGNQVDELEHLDLGGRIEIKHLERVHSHMSAKKANLVGKSNLKDLVLHWEGDGTSSDPMKMKDDESVLEALEPHIHLETLEINGFKGVEFPNWMNNMKNLTRIVIENCRNCRVLVPLGDLPLLKSLKLKDIDGLEYIDEEEGANWVRTKFPSLKYLQLDGLASLKGLLKEEQVGVTYFPNLKRVACYGMIPPSFPFKLPNLWSLYLSFRGMDDGTETWNNIAQEGLCNLRELSVWGTKNQRVPEKWLRGFCSSVTKLNLFDCKIGSCFGKGWLRHFTALETLWIQNCSELGDVAEEMIHLRGLKKLYMAHMDEIESIPQALQSLPSLQSLTLNRLRQLTSLPDWLPHLHSLTDLKIEGLVIPSLPSTIQQMKNLRSLRIVNCPQLSRRYDRKQNGEDFHIIAHIPHLHFQ